MIATVVSFIPHFGPLYRSGNTIMSNYMHLFTCLHKWVGEAIYGLTDYLNWKKNPTIMSKCLNRQYPNVPWNITSKHINIPHQISQYCLYYSANRHTIRLNLPLFQVSDFFLPGVTEIFAAEIRCTKHTYDKIVIQFHNTIYYRSFSLLLIRSEIFFSLLCTR